MCLLMMFQMDPLYAVIAIVSIVILYRGIQKSREGYSYNLGEIFFGAMTQATRYLKVQLQKSRSGQRISNWRPSIVMVNNRSFDRSAPLLFFSWLCYRYGFGTYLHYIRGDFDIKTLRESRKSLSQLIKYVASIRTRMNSERFLEELFSEDERIMISKRLGIVIMLEHKYSYSVIERVLGVSPQTISRIVSEKDSGRFKFIEQHCGKRKKGALPGEEDIWDELEKILLAGMPPRGKGRWAFLNELSKDNYLR